MSLLITPFYHEVPQKILRRCHDLRIRPGTSSTVEVLVFKNICIFHKVRLMVTVCKQTFLITQSGFFNVMALSCLIRLRKVRMPMAGTEMIL